jgi:hypothetical protein
MVDLLHSNMFKVYWDMFRSDSLRMQKGQTDKFGYLSMMVVATLGVLNTESFCECVLSCVKLVVSDLQVCLKVEEIRILCHSPHESRVHGVREGDLPGHSIVGIQRI